MRLGEAGGAWPQAPSPFVKRLEAKNMFGISPAMMMRWTEGMMGQFGDNEDDCRGDVYGC